MESLPRALRQQCLTEHADSKVQESARQDIHNGIATVHRYAFPERLEDPVFLRDGRIDRGHEIAQ